MSKRTVTVLSFAAAALFAIAGVLALVGGSTGTGALNLVAAALFLVAGIVRMRGGRGGSGPRGGGQPPPR